MAERTERLTKAQRAAVALLEQSREPGVVAAAGGSALLDGQPWINWRTAYSLRRRGLVTIIDYGEDGYEIVLKERAV